MVLVSHRLSIAILARRQGLTCILLRPAGGSEAFAASVAVAFDRARAGAGETVLLQWSGLRAYGRAATDYARTHGLATVYLELGNIAPKLFADPEGVNGAARLAQRPQELDHLAIDDAEVEAWIAATLEARRQIRPPQAVAADRINPWFIVDYLGAAVLRIPQPAPLTPLTKIINKLRAWRRPAQPPAVMPDRPYLFLPLQVHDEAAPGLAPRQVDRDAFAAAAAHARGKGLQLVVKPHPVEADSALLNDLAADCARDGHLLTSANTSALTEGAEAIVTVSSSVGLDALLMEKPVIILGDALFKNFTRRQAAVFCMAWLIDFQPYADQEISDEAADRLVGVIEQHA